jgi:nucleoside-diphosphate-sugar epimerase
MKKRVLITGSEGYLGNQICNVFLQKNFIVYGIDNKIKYGNIEKKNIINKNKNYRFLKIDCKNKKKIKKIATKCEYIIANAALVGGINSMNSFPYNFFLENIQINISTIEASLNSFFRKKLKKIVFISSSGIYEKNSKLKSKEGSENNMSFPNNFYSFEKLASERLLLAANTQYNIPYLILRPFNIIGHDGTERIKKSTHVIPDLIKKIKNNIKKIKIYGDGNQKRSFIHYQDVAEAIFKCTTSNKIINETINIGGPKGYKIIEIVKSIYKRIHPKKKLIIKKTKYFKIDHKNNVADISKLLKFSKFTFKYNIKKSLNSYFQK